MTTFNEDYSYNRITLSMAGVDVSIAVSMEGMTIGDVYDTLIRPALIAVGFEASSVDLLSPYEEEEEEDEMLFFYNTFCAEEEEEDDESPIPYFPWEDYMTQHP